MFFYPYALAQFLEGVNVYSFAVNIFRDSAEGKIATCLHPK